ncbi:MAG: BrnA antitoxin family protein [Phycisphaeraceae bacterium JB051]
MNSIDSNRSVTERTQNLEDAVITDAVEALQGKRDLPPGEPEYVMTDDQTPQITEEQFAQAVAIRERRLNPPQKKTFTIMLDHDVVTFFQNKGNGHQERINEVLVRYMMRIKQAERNTVNMD